MKNPTREFYRRWPYPGRFARRMEPWSRLPRPLARLGYGYWAAKLLRRRKYERVFGPIIEQLEAEFGSPLRVLDAGCGTGEESFRLAGAFPGRVDIESFDLSEKSLEAAQVVHERIRHLPGLDRIRFRRGNVLEPVEGSYQLVISNGVLHHTGNTELGLYQITRPLAIGGALYLYLYSSYGWLDDDAQRQGLLRIAELEGKPLDDMGETAMALRLGSSHPRWEGRKPMVSASWIDCFSNPCVERFTIREVFAMLERCGLAFESFDPDNSLEPAKLGVPREIVAHLEQLVPLERYTIMEQIRLPECHELFARNVGEGSPPAAV